MTVLVVDIEPVLFRIGAWTIRWFGVCLIAAVLAGLFVGVREAERRGLSSRAVIRVASWALPIGLLGARGLHIAEHWEYYLAQPADLLNLANGGFAFWGGLIAAGGAALLVGRGHLALARLADASAPALCVGEALGRFGSFLNGDGQGRISHLPWATRYSSNDALTPDFGAARHPAQLYQAAADVCILGVMLALRRLPLPEGVTFWSWLALYGASRALIGTVRIDPPVLLGLQLGQGLGVVAVLLSAVGIILAFTTRRSQPRRTQERVSI